MKATPLRHRIKIYRPTSKRSKTGTVTAQTWEHTLTLWAKFTPLSVKDVINAQSAQTDITARCQIRHRHDIDHTMRVEYTGRMYEIVGEPLADNDTGLEHMTLMLRGLNG